MTDIWTARISYPGPDKVDISMKCEPRSLGTAFQPGWDLIMGFKNGKITEAQYYQAYWERMRVSYATNKPYWDALMERLEVTLVCFCRIDTFCHRVILGRDILGKHFNNATYKGERIPNGRW